MSIKISKHAKQRSKERLGVKASSFERILPRIVAEGRRAKDFVGSFKRYLDNLHMSYPGRKDIIVYAHQIYIMKDTTIVTVLHVPQKYIKVIDK
jgi:hypothetical protein